MEGVRGDQIIFDPANVKINDRLLTLPVKVTTQIFKVLHGSDFRIHIFVVNNAVTQIKVGLKYGAQMYCASLIVLDVVDLLFNTCNKLTVI